MFKRVRKTSIQSMGVRIAANIALAIVSGRLREGELIPSRVILSEFFGLSGYEMDRIYLILLHNGWIYSVRNGFTRYLVAKGANKKNRHDFYITIADYLYDTVSEAKEAGFTQADISEIVRLTYEDQAPLYSELPLTIQAYIDRMYPKEAINPQWL